MRKWLWIVGALLVSVLASAQSKIYSIKGVVYEEATEETIVGAGVRLLHQADSLYVAGSSTGTKGQFSLANIAPGKYLLHISFLGMEPYYKEVEVVNKSVNLGKIHLSESVTRLGVLEVRGQATPMTVKQDTIQFNTAAFKVRQGASLEELLRRIPGMEIDEDGKITYNGEAIERIEMDGRSFFGNDPQMATRNLPSDMIKNLQVVDKKSDEARLTGMSDGEKVKVLNLEIKEDKKRGLISNLSAGYGTQQRYTANALVNLFNHDARYTIIGELNNIDGVRRGRGEETTRRIGGNYDDLFLNKTLKITAEAFYNSRDFSVDGKTMTTQLLGGEKANNEAEQYHNFRRNEEVNLNGRLEWNPQESTMLVYEPYFRYNWNKTDNSSQFQTTNRQGIAINDGQSLQTNDGTSYEANGDLHFRHTFNELGRNVYARLSYRFNGSDGEGLQLSETNFRRSQEKKLRDQQQRSYDRGESGRFRVAYLEPFSKEWALQLMYDANFGRRKSDQSTFNKSATGEYTELDPIYSRGSENSYFTHMIMARLRYKLAPRSYLYAGMGVNPSTSHTISTQGGEVTFDKQRTVWNYAPTAILEYRPSDSLQINIRYNGRTSQPSMSQLNPATIVLSPLAQVQGNPDLLPSFSHSVWGSINFNRPMARQSLNMMWGWNLTNNAVAPIQKIDATTGVRQTSYQNISGNQSLFGGFMMSLPIGGASSKWSSFTFGRVRYSRDKGFVNEALNRADVWRPMLSQRVTWSGPWLQATIGGFAMMQQAKNSISTEMDSRTWDYNAYGEAVVTLPFGLSFTSKLTYQDASGYQDQLKRNFWLLDASVSYSFLKEKRGTLQLSGYDLLQQRTTFMRQISLDRITDSEVNGITSYVMLTFSYRFNNMGADVRSSGMNSGQRYGRGYRRH